MFGFGKRSTKSTTGSMTGDKSKTTTNAKAEKKSTYIPKKGETRNKGTNPVNVQARKGQRQRKGLIPTVTNTKVKTPVGGNFITFGPIIREFLESNKLGMKSLNISYSHDNAQESKMDITLSFSELNDTGLGWGKIQQMNIDQYMSVRTKLIGKGGDPTDQWTAFAQQLLLRVGVRIAVVPSRGLTSKVIEMVKKHLTPLEYKIMELKDEEWNKIDVSKLRGPISKQTEYLKSYYIGFKDRAEYLSKAIKGDSAIKAIEPFDWAIAGVFYPSRSEIVNSFSLRITLDETQVSAVEDLRVALSGASASSSKLD